MRRDRRSKCAHAVLALLCSALLPLSSRTETDVQIFLLPALRATQVRLAGAFTPMFCQSDRWSCGYRNAQTLFGALLLAGESGDGGGSCGASGASGGCSGVPLRVRQALFGGRLLVPTVGSLTRSMRCCLRALRISSAVLVVVGSLFDLLDATEPS